MELETCEHCGRTLGSAVAVGPEGALLHPECTQPYTIAVAGSTGVVQMYEGEPPRTADDDRYPLSPDH